MQMRVPKTITGLVAAGCLLAAMPLIAALILAAVTLEQLARKTESLLDHGLATTQLAMQLRDNLVDLERSGRQYIVLQDPRLLDLAEHRWLDAASAVEQLHDGPAQSASLMVSEQIGRRFGEARGSWHDSGASSHDQLTAIDSIHDLQSQADSLAAASRADTALKMRQLRGDVAWARGEMLICAMTLVPLTALLAWGFSVAVTRPVKRMFRTIAAIGHGRYEPGAPAELPRELRRLGEQIEWLRKRLARLEKDKDSFLRQVSHELKTPLSTLREGTELLREGALGELTQRQGEVAAIVSDATVELEGLIDNLLTYSEWRAGRQESHKSWFDAGGLIDEVLAVHRLRLSKRELRMELAVQEDRLFGLRTQMRIALDNLVTNAIKHSPPGACIAIIVSSTAGLFELSVRDFGRGVADAEKEMIFEPFVRGSESEEQGIRGTGIGLSIVRETLHAHGGEVSVEDAHPGARFVLQWPSPDA